MGATVLKAGRIPWCVCMALRLTAVCYDINMCRSARRMLLMNHSAVRPSVILFACLAVSCARHSGQAATLGIGAAPAFETRVEVETGSATAEVAAAGRAARYAQQGEHQQQWQGEGAHRPRLRFGLWELYES